MKCLFSIESPKKGQNGWENLTWKLEAICISESSKLNLLNTLSFCTGDKTSADAIICEYVLRTSPESCSAMLIGPNGDALL